MKAYVLYHNKAVLASVFKAFDKNNSVTSLYVLFVCALHQYHAFSAIIFTAVHSRRLFFSRTFPPVIFTAVRFRRLFFSRTFPPVIFTAVRFRRPFFSRIFPRPFLLPCVSAGHFYSRAFPPVIFTAVHSRRLFFSRTFPPVIFTAVRFRRPFFSRTFPQSFLQPYIPAAIFTAVRFRGHSYCLTLKCTPSCSAIFLQFSIFSSPITSTTLRMVYIPSAAAERAKSSIML